MTSFCLIKPVKCPNFVTIWPFEAK
jgi:hypothetical protein